MDAQEQYNQLKELYLSSINRELEIGASIEQQAKKNKLQFFDMFEWQKYYHLNNGSQQNR
jgi:hypothetical protein